MITHMMSILVDIVFLSVYYETYRAFASTSEVLSRFQFSAGTNTLLESTVE